MSRDVGRSAPRLAGLLTLLLGVAASGTGRAQDGLPSDDLPVAPQAVAAKPHGPRQLRNIVVPQFTPPNARARALVLRTLADHAEVEVMAIDDVAFAARRLQADPNTPEGRAKLSRELGIDAWLDGTIGADASHLTLTAGDGQVLQELDVATEDPKQLDERTAERMWFVLGPRLSAREAYQRALLALNARARHKLDARTAELERQIKLAHELRQRRALWLRAQFSLAKRKQAALTAEQTRQTELGHQELARQAEEARQVELARQAEEARKAELARLETERKAEEKRQAEAARKAEIARKAEEKREAEAARKAEIARKAEEKRDERVAEAARKSERARAAKAERQEALARKAARVREANEARREQLAQARADKAEAKQERAAERKAAAEERALAKRSKHKRALGKARLANTGDQSPRAHARAKKAKPRTNGKQSASERYSQRRTRSKAAAGSSKDDADGPRASQLLSKQ